jgi:hypothetical protein
MNTETRTYNANLRLAELVTGARQVGLAERVLGAAQAAWPLVVVVFCRMSTARRGSWSLR